MKSELFVIKAVTGSERAFSAVAEYIPSQSPQRLLRVLQNPRKLKATAMELGVKEDEVFLYLEKAIIIAFNRRTVTQLSRQHISMLLEDKVQSLVAEVLNCATRDALHVLFDVSALQMTLEEYVPYIVRGGVIDARRLIMELTRQECAQELEYDYDTDENRWEPILTDLEWLSARALKILPQSEKTQAGQTPCQSLAELIESSQQERVVSLLTGPPEGKNTINALGLLALRRNLSWMKDRLQDQAIELAEKAASISPTSPSMQLLLPLLHLYGMGNIAKGLNAIPLNEK